MRRLFPISFWLVCAGTLLCGSWAMAAGPNVIYGYDTHGRAITRLGDAGASAIVLFFLATDCPISNRYVPEIRRLRGEFAARHAVVWLVYPNTDETAEGVVHHNAAYGLDTPEFRRNLLLHPTAALTARVAARVTPEAAVLAGEESSEKSDTEKSYKVVYLGRIDDRYLDIGRERPQATSHDLERAVIAVATHRPVARPGGAPVGCGIISPEMVGQP